MSDLKKFRIYWLKYEDGNYKHRSRLVTCTRVDVNNVANGSCVLECISGDLQEVVAAFNNWDYFVEVTK